MLKKNYFQILKCLYYVRPSFFLNVEIKMISSDVDLFLVLKSGILENGTCTHTQTLARHKVLGLWRNIIRFMIRKSKYSKNNWKKILLMCSRDLKTTYVYIRFSNPFYFIQVSHFTIIISGSNESMKKRPNESSQQNAHRMHNIHHQNRTGY